MATLVLKTATALYLNSSDVPNTMQCTARKGILRELGTSHSVPVHKKFSFKVELKKHKDWISNHATFRHLEVTTEYLIASSYIPTSDCPTPNPPYDSLKALKQCRHNGQSLLDKFKSMINNYSGPNPNQKSLRDRMILQLLQLDNQFAQQLETCIIEDLADYNGESMSRAPSLEPLGGGSSSSKSYGGSEDSGGGGSHNHFGGFTPPSTPSTPSVSSSHKQTPSGNGLDDEDLSNLSQDKNEDMSRASQVNAIQKMINESVLVTTSKVTDLNITHTMSPSVGYDGSSGDSISRSSSLELDPNQHDNGVNSRLPPFPKPALPPPPPLPPPPNNSNEEERDIESTLEPSKPTDGDIL